MVYSSLYHKAFLLSVYSQKGIKLDELTPFCRFWIQTDNTYTHTYNPTPPPPWQIQNNIMLVHPLAYESIKNLYRFPM